MKTREEVKEFYEKFTKTLIRDRIFPNPRHYKIITFLKKILSERQIGSALEIGCGIGILSEYISNKVSKVVSIDISEENIIFAKATVKNVEFHRADFLDFPADENYDLITLFDVLEHFPKAKHPQVFQKIQEFSNENSVIAITIPDADFLSYIRKHHPEKLQVVDESIYFDELKKIIDDSKFEILKYEKYGIDYDNQYRFYLLGYKKEKYSLERKIMSNEGFFSKIPRKLFHTKKKIIGKFKFKKYLKSNQET
jgi:trans-aconitate 2-methyltransferase